MLAIVVSILLSAFWFIDTKGSGRYSMEKINWATIGLILAWDLIWFVVMDFMKVLLYQVINRGKLDEEIESFKLSAVEPIQESSSGLSDDDTRFMRKSMIKNYKQDKSMMGSSFVTKGSIHAAKGIR